MLKTRDIVCLSLTPWETLLPSTVHYLMREFSRHHRILFVDHPLTFKDCWSQRLNSRWYRTMGLRPRLREAGRLHVLTPPAITSSAMPGRFFDLAMEASARMVAKSIRGAMAELGMRRPLLWIAFDVPLGLHLVGKLEESLVIYHCYDEISGEPYIARHGTRLEHALFEQSDLVFTTSQTLYEAKRPHHPSCHWVPNGVDFERFASAQDLHLHPHPALLSIPEPRLGYLGNLESRLDFDLLTAIALRRPEWSLVLMGPVQEGFESALSQLKRLPNIHHLGPCPPHDAPRFLKGLDVALIPFVLSIQTQSVYPLKLNEYLAAGLPVVMTPFAPLPEFEAVCWQAQGAEAFERAIEDALEARGFEHVVRRQAIAERHDWSERAAEVGRILASKLEEAKGEQS